MHVQRVHTQVICSEIHALKDLPQRLLSALLHVHDLLQVSLHRTLDETQQVLLVHAGRGMDVCVHLGCNSGGMATGFPGVQSTKGGRVGVQDQACGGGPTLRML